MTRTWKTGLQGRSILSTLGRPFRRATSTAATNINTVTISQPIHLGSLTDEEQAENAYQLLVPHEEQESYGISAVRTVKEMVMIVKEVSDVFPPLKSAAAGLLLVLERIEVSIFIRRRTFLRKNPDQFSLTSSTRL